MFNNPSPIMMYDLTLRAAGLVVGLGLLVTHAAALVMPEKVAAWMKVFPRSRPAGLFLCSLAALWAFWLGATMDLGEFSPQRTLICGVILAGAVMVPMFAEEFLAVRALGILALLAAEPLLGSAFLRPEQSRLLLVVLAYLWASAGLVMVGAPYLLRDAIEWLTAARWRFLLAAGSGAVYGVTLIVVSLLFYQA
ncbi:MAG: hypothetical protein ACO3YO_06670 [Chthoniobacterales bacterium]